MAFGLLIPKPPVSTRLVVPEVSMRRVRVVGVVLDLSVMLLSGSTQALLLWRCVMMVKMVVVRERRGIFASSNIFHFRIQDQTCFPRLRSHTLGLDDEDSLEVLL